MRRQPRHPRSRLAQNHRCRTQDRPKPLTFAPLAATHRNARADRPHRDRWRCNPRRANLPQPPCSKADQWFASPLCSLLPHCAVYRRRWHRAAQRRLNVSTQLERCPDAASIFQCYRQKSLPARDHLFSRCVCSLLVRLPWPKKRGQGVCRRARFARKARALWKKPELARDAVV